MSKKEKIVVSSIAVVIVLAVAATIAVIANNRYLATTMRLLRVEGTVNIEDSTGEIKPVIDNIRFESGDALSTGSDGLASVGLDDTKIVTLENDSRVEFTKQGKQLELNLTQGALFFEVTEKLADDETYEIKTSNMTVGIRGTSGYVYYSESGLQSLIITDGVVKVTGYNPKTQETKVVEVRGGESVTTYLYDESTEDRDSIEFEIKEVPVSELPEFPLQMLAENEALLEKVCADTGWDKDELLALVTALTDTENPTPTPDAIIEITDTPTPTSKPKTAVTLTPTGTSSPSPSPSTKPTASATGTPAPGSTNAPGASSTIAPTTAPSTTPTATPKITTTPSSTPKPTTTVKPTATPTAKPTATPTVATYTVTFITNNKCTAPATQTITEGGKATKPSNPSAEGYTFGGWYRDSACTNAYNFNSAVTSNVVLYAKWTHITYTVTFDTDGLGTAPKDQTVNHGDPVGKPANPSAEGYTFSGWYTNNDFTEKYDFDSEVTSDITIYAKWTSIICSVVFVHGHDMLPGSQYVEYNGTVTKPEEPTLEGYAFDGWYSDSNFNNPYDFSAPVKENLYIYAKWTPITTPVGGPTLPSGYTYTSIWGTDYQGNTCYICKLNNSSSAESFGTSPATYRGYSGGYWYDLDYSSVNNTYTYAKCGDTASPNTYYSDAASMGGALNYVTPDDIPSGYEKREYYSWGTDYNGRTIYICMMKVSDDTSNYKGYYSGTWYDLYMVSSSTPGENEGSVYDTFTFYYVGSNEVYYEETYFLA
ncbi:MAG: InlB B-repeat-containing protein [Saccharofermentans sp.]|nr:InlB B-repeat-containing protein [Saccharofermentans sp.]